MSKLPDQADMENFTVFDGSSPEDVSHARELWNSVSLLPPPESRLVSADIRQRLPVSRRKRGFSSAAPAPAPSPEPPCIPALLEREEERRRYLAMADQRKEILALLRRQREQRIQKELVFEGFRPKGKISREKSKPLPDLEMEQDEVKQLQ